MMHTDELHDRLIRLGDHLDAERLLRESASDGTDSVISPNLFSLESAPAGGRRVTISAAAAVLIVAAAGAAVFLTVGRDARDAVSVSTAGGGPDVGAGLFPVGDIETVTNLGIEDPATAAMRYLQDRVANAPAGVQLRPRAGFVRQIGNDRAIVDFSLQGVDDSGDGRVLVENVHSTGGWSGWVVLSASIIGFDIPTISYDDGTLTGSVATSRGGTTIIEVFDAATNTSLTSTEVIQPAAGDDPIRSEFVIYGLTPPSIAVRFWNVVDLANQSGSGANFAEVRLYDGDRNVTAGWTPLAKAGDGVPIFVQPFGDGTVSALERVGTEPLVIADSPDMRIVVTRESPTDNTCIEFSLADSKVEIVCFEPVFVAGGLAAATTDPNSRGDILAVGVVPDEVDTVTDQEGTTQPHDNVWFKIIDDAPRTVTVASTDGSQLVDVTLIH